MSIAAFEILDPDGIWIQSKASFPLIVPTTLHRLMPGRTVRLNPTAWVQMQIEARALCLVESPLALPEEVPRLRQVKAQANKA